MPSDHFLFQTRPHPIVLIGWLVLVVLAAVLLSLTPQISRFVAIFVPVWGLGAFLLEYFCIIYEATPEVIAKRQGLLWRREERIPIEAIRDLKFSSGPLGVLIGYGRLEIESADTEGKIVLHVLPTWAYRTLRPLRRHRTKKKVW